MLQPILNNGGDINVRMKVLEVSKRMEANREKIDMDLDDDENQGLKENIKNDSVIFSLNDNKIHNVIV